MATTKISVSVDSELLETVKRLVNSESVSSILTEALREKVHRLQVLALLDEMERESPISEAGKAAGEKLWQSMQSSSTPAQSALSRTKTTQSARRSTKR